MQKLSSVGSLTLLCVACLTIMVGCVIVPGLASISNALEVPKAASWLVTLPSLGVVVFGIVAGKAISRFGARNALIWGLALYGAIGYSCVWLTGYGSVLANRFLLGGATALVMAGGTTLISEFFDGESRLRMIARQGMAIEIGGVIFLAIGGMLAVVGWQHPFLLYLVAWVFLAMVLAFIPAGARPATVSANASSDQTKMWDVYLAALCSMIVFFAAVILLPTKLAGLGFDEAGTGYFLAFVSLVAAAAAFLMPHLERGLGGSGTTTVAFAFYAVAHTLFFASSSMAIVIIGGIFVGCGFGFSIPLVNHMTIERSAPSQRGRLLGYLSVAIFLGQFLSSFIELAPLSKGSSFLVACLVAVIALIVFAKATVSGRTSVSA